MTMLQCMLCSFSDDKSILSHIRNVHSLSSKDYKKQFPNSKTRVSWMDGDTEAMSAFQTVGRSNSAKMVGSIGRHRLRVGQWGARHTSCQGCGTTSEKHFAKGLCTSCYKLMDALKKTERNNQEIMKTGTEGVDYVLCMECGKPFLNLSESGHLSIHGMTFQEYRNKYPEAIMTAEKTESRRRLGVSVGRKRFVLKNSLLNSTSQIVDSSNETSEVVPQGTETFNESPPNNPVEFIAQWFSKHGMNVQYHNSEQAPVSIFRRFPVLDRHIVDFAIPSRKVAIEVWSDSWHVRDYRSGLKKIEDLDELEKVNICEDDIRLESLSEAGWTVTRIWERDVRSPETEAVLLLAIDGIPSVGQKELTVCMKQIAYTPRKLFNLRWIARENGIEVFPGLNVAESKTDLLKSLVEKFGNKRVVPEEMLLDLLGKCRKNGFPYYDMSEDQMHKRWSSIRAFDPRPPLEGAYLWDGHGTELASFFHPHMFECRKKGKMSAIEFFNNDEMLLEGLYKVMCLSGNVSKSGLRNICRNESNTSRINNFPPKVCITIAKTLFGKEVDKISVLDPCAGFGGRLLGFPACGVKKYDCIDMSEKTCLCLNKELDFLCANGLSTEVSITCSDCNIAMSERINNGDSYDMVMTSPPFVDREEYVGVDFFNTAEDWANLFMNPFLKNSFALLKPNGKLALFLGQSDSGGNNLPKIVNAIARSSGFGDCEVMPFLVGSGEVNRRINTFRKTYIQIWTKPA